MGTSTTLLTAGLACIIAAIIGGGLKAYGIEIAALRSAKRQGLLAAFGLVLIAASLIAYASGAPQGAAREVLLFDNGNDRGVLNNPPKPAQFEISEPHFITSIYTYHWNNEQSALPGHIGLRHEDGTMFGPWEANESGPGRQKDWICKPDTIIPPGLYTIVDSEPATWSWNPKDQRGVGTGGVGMSKVKGIPVQGRFDMLWHWLGF